MILKFAPKPISFISFKKLNEKIRLQVTRKEEKKTVFQLKYTEKYKFT